MYEFTSEQYHVNNVIYQIIKKFSEKEKPKLMESVISHVPDFFIRNLQLYEGILTHFYMHPCYWGNMMTHQSYWDPQDIYSFIEEMYSYIPEGPLKIASLTQIAILIYAYEQSTIIGNDYNQLFISKIFVKCLHKILFSMKASRNLIINFAKDVITDIFFVHLAKYLLESNWKEKLFNLYRFDNAH